MIGFKLRIINLHFLISMIGILTKAKIRLSCMADYLEYQQKIKNLFCYENKVFLIHSFAASSNNNESKIPQRSCCFLLKKTKKAEMGNPKRIKCSVYLEGIKK